MMRRPYAPPWSEKVFASRLSLSAHKGPKRFALSALILSLCCLVPALKATRLDLTLVLREE